MWRRPSPLGLLLVSSVVAGCNTPTRAGRITELKLPEPTFEASVFDERRVLVKRFTEGRPPKAGENTGGLGIIIPHGYRDEYTTSYREETDDGEIVAMGWLPFDLPFLLARMLPGDQVHAADGLADAGAGQSWDYVVEGRLLTTQSSSHTAVVLIYLSLLGIPARFDHYALRYQVSLYHHSDPEHPVSSRIYAFEDDVSVGLYYNHKRAARLPNHALVTTLSEAARDLVQDVQRHEARRRLPPPPSAAAPR